MKKVIIILNIFLSITVVAQINDSATFRPFHLGLSFSPDYSNSVIKTDDNNEWMKQIYDTLETGKFGYTAGINLIFQLNRNFFVGSGLFVSDKGERTKKYVTQPVNNYVNHYYYMEVPFKAGYYLINKKVKFFLTVGASCNVYLKGRTVREADDTGRKETSSLGDEISRVNFSFVGGMGINCPLTERWHFILEPNYKRSVSAITNSPVKKYLYSFGANLGLFYTL